MKVVLFGEDTFTAAVLQSLIEHRYIVPAIVCPFRKNNPEHTLLENAAKRNSVPFIAAANINDSSVGEQLQAMNADLIVCVHLEKILAKEIYSIPAKGAINVHPSLLPKYRGLSPQHQALMHGDTETGVTIHYLDDDADTGNIILQEKIALAGDMYIFDLLKEMMALYKKMVPQAISLICKNDFRSTRQQASGASWFGKLKNADRQLDLTKTKFAAYNLIRAVSKPYKGAFYNDTTIWTSYIPDRKTESVFLEKYPEAGVYELGDQLLIRLRDGILLSDDFETT